MASGGSAAADKVTFQEFKGGHFGNGVNGSNHKVPHYASDFSGGAFDRKPYKLMKSAERGEINTHNFVMCGHHHHQNHDNKPCSCGAQ